MSPTKHTPNHVTSARDFKNRVLTCLNKLSDRDTHSAAATELESIAKTLSFHSIQPFISSISVTESSDKSPVRKQCVRLISTLSESHGDVLSPFLSKLLTAVIRRLRDPDTVVRAACVAATASLAACVTKPPFTAVAKPLVDALVTEQDVNSQTGAALCLAAVVSHAPDPDLEYLRRVVVPRIERLLKCDSFKAKAALLNVIDSVVAVGAVSKNVFVIKNLVNLMVEFVAKSEDWNVRKGAAEVLERIAVLVEEKEVLAEFKASCLKTFEAKRFDKVKSVRETMSRMIEAWNAIPDVSKEARMQLESSKEEVDVQFPPRTPQTSRRSVSCGSSPSTTTTRRTSFENRKTGPAMFRKLDRKKPDDRKLEIAIVASAATQVTKDDGHVKTRSMKEETKRALFSEISEEKMPDSAYHEQRSTSRVPGNSVDSDFNLVPQDTEDLSLIRNQLLQIETRQTNLFDLLEKFIGSSQDGMRSLESRVHGLESTLDEISFDLAKSTGRMSNPSPTLCCKLPGADLLSSKLWRKSENQHSDPAFSSYPLVKNKNPELSNTGFRHKSGGGGLIKNPLAERH
uniref:TORTIFOLIA1-like protein 3 n=1 Tax=Erigeron canadensis TaxID=72917 RepID=UPI001CB9A793|nr:TORTIFOLIA1-like protein 3 [Erigeron canadensis]